MLVRGQGPFPAYLPPSKSMFTLQLPEELVLGSQSFTEAGPGIRSPGGCCAGRGIPPGSGLHHGP